MKTIDVERRNSAGILSSLFSGFTWGLNTVLLRYILLLIPFFLDPALAVGGFFICSFLHDFFGAIWLTGIMGARGYLKGFFISILTKEGLIIALGALCGGPLAMTCYIFALTKGGVALTVGVTACYPLIGTILAVIFLKERMAARRWLGLLFVVLGIYYLNYTPGAGALSNKMPGTLLALGAAFGWAVEGVLCGYGMKRGSIDHKAAALIREFVSACAYLIITPILLGGIEDFGNVLRMVFEYPKAWILLAITALIGMYSFYMWYKGIRLIGAARSLCLNVTYPLWALIFSAIILGISISGYNIFGSVFVIIGVILATLLKPGELNRHFHPDRHLPNSERRKFKI